MSLLLVAVAAAAAAAADWLTAGIVSIILLVFLRFVVVSYSY